MRKIGYAPALMMALQKQGRVQRRVRGGVFGRRTGHFVARLAIGVAASACGGDDDRFPEPRREPAKTSAAERRDMSPSQRLLGTWTLRLSEMPDGALNDDLKSLRERGLEDKVEVEYRFTESEFVLRKRGAGGPLERRWKYRIVQEGEDTLQLERIGPEGETQRIVALVMPERLELGRGGDLVVLRRK